MIGLLLTCEHARAAVPAGVDLGVEAARLDSHIAFDRGALRLARALQERTGAALHAGRYTRLVVDLNRREDNPDVIPTRSHGVVIPGNAQLSSAQRAARLDTWHRPWRVAVFNDARALTRRGRCLHLSIHAFDPEVDASTRAFDVGVLFDPARSPERARAGTIRDALVAATFDARLNAPFAGTPEGTTSWLRGQLGADRYTGIELEASYRWVDDPVTRDRYISALVAVLGRL